jgi:tripartite-type tricarboxylate transporter receptor subunit TctC
MADIVARLVSHHLSQKLSQPFIIDNRSGGAGAIGAIQVANAAPDGTVFMFTSPSAILTVPMLHRVIYDPASFVPISIVANLPFILGIRSSLPPKTWSISSTMPAPIRGNSIMQALASAALATLCPRCS